MDERKDEMEVVKDRGERKTKGRVRERSEVKVVVKIRRRRHRDGNLTAGKNNPSPRR